MIKFSENELDYIKSEMEKVLDIFENEENTKENLKNYIKQVSGKCIDIALMFSSRNWELMGEINEKKHISEMVIDFCWDGLGMWVWQESECETKEDVKEFVPDDIYCEIYEKIIKNFQENNEEE